MFEGKMNVLINKSDRYYESALADIDRGSYDRAVSTLYYSVFYLVNAIMVNRGVVGNKHTFVRTFVNKVMFKEGQEISAGLAQMYNRAYMLRDLADYSFDTPIPVTFEDAIEIAEFVPRFKDAVLKILQGSG